MSTYFRLLGRYGFPLWGTLLLGTILFFLMYIMATLLFYLVCFLFLLIAGGSAAAMESAVTDPDMLAATFGPVAVIGLILLFILYYVSLFFIMSFHMAGSHGMINQVALDETFSLKTYFITGFLYFWKMSLQFLLISIFFIPVVLVLAMMRIFLIPFEGTPLFDTLTTIILIGFLVVYLFYLLAVLFAPTILTVENMGPWKSLKHSFRLFFKSFGKVFVTGVFTLVPYLLYIGVFTLAIALLGPAGDSPSGLKILSIFLFLFLFGLIFPLIQAAMMLVPALRYKMHFRHWVAPPSSESATEPGIQSN
ncbi:hypothetical protein [Paludifilum halophilum]|uniref:Glycerophosphoryl diester phosphodiesterase membrane domain-containing protein n=1 Tax=Paludifilum halophilum TaxID=1642702 RepID=A0A235B7Q1_9BACL|nr:hypothetical protein [Paludifilum halophilum]OYD08334.1 hypothetical protein CHM34_05665 [Paludifilum halophilum]